MYAHFKSLFIQMRRCNTKTLHTSERECVFYQAKSRLIYFPAGTRTLLMALWSKFNHFHHLEDLFSDFYEKERVGPFYPLQRDHIGLAPIPFVFSSLCVTKSLCTCVCACVRVRACVCEHGWLPPFTITQQLLLAWQRTKQPVSSFLAARVTQRFSPSCTT